MPTSFAECSQVVERLNHALRLLERTCRILDLPPLDGREWYELLTRKLLPQLSDNAYLVVAVVGGTNIGKSVIFNHIAGFHASATSPLASGTKHPVCLVPSGFAEQHDLHAIFSEFELEPWSRSETALEEGADDRLFWRTSEQTPENLLILDTPDIDSDAPVNWRRADSIRRCADVLIAVLTQQKYNDAAVKQFFRKAAAEDKVAVVVFNQCQLPDDESYWPLWVRTFCDETGIEPELIYVAPNDRRAAEELRLPFYRRNWPAEGAASTEGDAAEESQSLMEALSRLHFGEIKLRTLQGSMQHLLDAEQGVPAYLAEIEQQSARFRSAADLLATESLLRREDWPVVPNDVLIAEVRRWWQTQREGWSATVHNFYNAVGAGIVWPIRFARERLQGEPEPPLEAYRREEWEEIVLLVEGVYQKLTLVSEGHELLRRRLEGLLTGLSRAELLERMHEEHRRFDLESELRQVVAHKLRTFPEDSPTLYKALRRADVAAAAARPVMTMALFVVGAGPVGDALVPMAADAAAHSTIWLASEGVKGAVGVAVGEPALNAVGRGMARLTEWLRGVQAAFAARRGAWLAEILVQHVLGSLPNDLREAARLPESEPFQRVRSVLGELERKIA